jgi:hypothetical protein
MSNFSNALATQTLRLSSTVSAIAPANNAAAISALVGAEKVNMFLEPYARKGKKIKGFTEFHPHFFQVLYSNLVALEYGASLARARGDGRLASSVDQVKSIGNGFGLAMKSIERFLQIEDGTTDKETIKKRNLVAVFPTMQHLHRSGDILSNMIVRLGVRRNAIEYMEAGGRIDALTKKSLLIGGRWDEARIIEYTIEYLSRAFAYALSEDVRHKLVAQGTEGISLREAMDSLKPRFLLPAS